MKQMVVLSGDKSKHKKIFSGVNDVRLKGRVINQAKFYYFCQPSIAEALGR
jgi:hypothetical protein